MPLAFESLNYGTVAFGFFNIKTDAMLLNEYFFFSTDFCRAVEEAADSTPYEGRLDVYVIENPGDLHAAIEGLAYEGFIGEVYRIYPFPKDLKEFKQDPEGYRNRKVIERIMELFGKRESVEFYIGDSTARIGVYAFDGPWFCRLIEYVAVGGYPRWKGEPPSYVKSMIRHVLESEEPIFHYLKTPIS